MSNVIDRTIEKIKSQPDFALERMAQYRLSDAIRSGSAVSGQAFNWSQGDNLCALSAAVCDATARGYMS